MYAYSSLLHTNVMSSGERVDIIYSQGDVTNGNVCQLKALPPT
jgi:hypothetical protein